MAEIIVKDKNGTRVFALRDSKPLFAGRTAECDVYLQSPGVSRRHAVFMVRNGICGIKDLGSSNGTYLNGRKLTRSVRLKNGDVVRIADVHIQFRASGSEHTESELAQETAAAGSASSRRKPATPADNGEKRKNTTRTEAPAQTSRDLPPPEADSEPPSVSVPPAHPEPESIQPTAHPGSASDARPMEEEGPTAAFQAEEIVATPAEIPPRPKLPTLPTLGDITDDDIGEGESDDGYLAEDSGENDDDDAAAVALTKAAEEAGIVGEFAPDTEEEDNAGQTEPSPPQSGPYAFSQTLVQPEDMEENPNAVPLDQALRMAAEARLCLYSFLADLKQEREDFLARRPNAADAVKAELARQDREMDKIPNAQQAEGMIEKRQAKRNALLEKIKEAKANGENPPPKPSRDMHA